MSSISGSDTQHFHRIDLEVFLKANGLLDQGAKSLKAGRLAQSVRIEDVFSDSDENGEAQSVDVDALLAALPQAELEALAARLEASVADLVASEALFEGDDLEHLAASHEDAIFWRGESSDIQFGRSRSKVGYNLYVLIESETPVLIERQCRDAGAMATQARAIDLALWAAADETSAQTIRADQVWQMAHVVEMLDEKRVMLAGFFDEMLQNGAGSTAATQTLTRRKEFSQISLAAIRARIVKRVHDAGHMAVYATYALEAASTIRN